MNHKKERIEESWKTRTRKIYTIKESARALFLAVITLPKLIAARLDKVFVERIMLAVTQVNGCPMCSYEHSKIALKAGMSTEEIESLVSGSYDFAPKEEHVALLFAEHYADTRGYPETETIEKLYDTYGEKKANGILGAIRIITMGNAYGIALGGFLGRFTGKKDNRTTFLYEVGNLISFGVLVLPFLLYMVLTFLFRRKYI